MSRNHRPTCPSCEIRFRVEPPAIRDAYSPILLTAYEVMWLENAARFFDEVAGEDRFTAEQFVSWLKPDLSGRRHRNHTEFDGRAVYLGGGRKGAGRGTTRIASADPLPVVPAFVRRLVS